MLAIFCSDHTTNSKDLLSLLLVTWHKKREGTRQQPQLNLMHPTGKCSLLLGVGSRGYGPGSGLRLVCILTCTARLYLDPCECGISGAVVELLGGQQGLLASL